MAEISVSAKVGEIRVRSGKDPEVKLELHLTDQEVLQLYAWRSASLTVTIVADAQQLAFPEGVPSSTSNLQAIADGEEPAQLFQADAGTWIVNDDRMPILHLEGDPDPVYRLTGAEIRRLAEPAVAEDEPLWVQEVELVGDDATQAVYEQPGGWRSVGDTELLEIKADMRFQTGFRNPGKVDDVEPVASDEAEASTDPAEDAGPGDPVAAAGRRARRGVFAADPVGAGAASE